MKQRSRPLFVDNFAGGGGASLGIARAIGREVDIAINHNDAAIAMHRANHPNTIHYCENVFDVDPRKVCRDRRVIGAWFSPDCTHFSKAAGSRPRSGRVRGLAWIVLRWAALVRPEVIFIENVEEFATWGPLTRKRGRKNHPQPCRFRKYRTFHRWYKQLSDLGYEIDYRELRACDYGTPTIRKRLFLIARCDGKPIVWPKPTHFPPAEAAKKNKPAYRTAAECIDWSLDCPSIFMTKEEAKEYYERNGIRVNRPLAENTMQRIARGVKRFVIEAREPFIVRPGHYSNITGEGKHFRGQSMLEPLSTITSKNDKAIIVPSLTRLSQTGGNGGYVNSVEDPLTTVVSKAEHLLVATHVSRFHGASVGSAMDEPVGTAESQNKHALVAAFLAKHFGGMTGVGVDTPMPTTTARGTQTQLVSSHLVKLRGTSKVGQDPREPMPTATAGGNHVGEVRAFLMKYYGTAMHGQAINEPLHTATVGDRFGLVVIHGELWQITDIGMRMLTPEELYTANGFDVKGFRGRPDGYNLYPLLNGKPIAKSTSVALCGNSVPPQWSEALVRANLGPGVRRKLASKKAVPLRKAVAAQGWMGPLVGK